MKIHDFQELMKEIYFRRDSQRGIDRTFLWIIEEIGELGRAIRTENREGMEEELADVIAWLSSIANLLQIDVEKAVLKKYGKGCPRCGNNPCTCTF